MSKEKAKPPKRFWDIFGFIVFGPIGSRYNSIFNVLADGDEKKEEEITYKTTKILHIIALFIVFTILITDIVILVIQGYGYDPENINSQGLVVSYVVLPILIILGAFFPKIVSWRVWSKTSKIGIFFNHIIRVFCFIGIAICGLVGMSNFTTFYRILPLLIISTISLLLIFPTKKKWKEWTEYTSQLE